MRRPLDDVRVLAIEQLGAGPWATLRNTFEDLRAFNPRIVCCSLSGLGNTGPRCAEPAYDSVVQALTGEPGGPPVKSGLSLVDFSGGYVSAPALPAGVWRARRDGVGCDTSLFALPLLTNVGTWAASRGHLHPRLGEVRQFGSRLRMGTSYTPAPARGEGTEPLLRELCGCDDARLREGAFG